MSEVRRRIYTHNIPTQLYVTLQVNRKSKIRMYILSDEYKNTAIASRDFDLENAYNFSLMLPINGKSVTFVAKNLSGGKIRILNIEKRHLQTSIPEVLYSNSIISEFVNHAISISLRMNVLQNGLYVSKKGNIKIELKDELTVFDKNGREMATKSVARVCSNTKIIEVSKKNIMVYTVSGIFAILCHEFAHVYMNTVATSEKEADDNAMMIYLGLGFSRVDLVSTWSKVYKNADNKGNRMRIDNYMAKTLQFDRN